LSASDVHEREAEQVATTPLARAAGSGVIGGKPYTPDAINRACLHQHPLAGAEKKPGQIVVLGELRHVAAHHNLVPVLIPNLLVEPCDLAPKRLGLTRVRRCQDLTSDLGVTEEHCLAPHHVVLHGREGQPVGRECRDPPLAQTAPAHAAVLLRLVSPEEQELDRVARLHQSDQLIGRTWPPRHVGQSAAALTEPARQYQGTKATTPALRRRSVR